MKRNQWKIKVGGAILTMSFVFGIAVLSVRAQAQNPDDRYSQDRNADQNRRGRDWDRYGNYGGSSELRRTALNAGYDEGIKDGRKDRMNGRHFGYQDSNAPLKTTARVSATANCTAATSARDTRTDMAAKVMGPAIAMAIMAIIEIETATTVMGIATGVTLTVTTISGVHSSCVRRL